MKVGLCSGFSDGLGGGVVAIDVVDAGADDDDGAAFVGFGYGASHDVGVVLAIASLSLLMGREGGTGLMLALELTGFGLDLLPHT
jgi:hypothetical protein